MNLIGKNARKASIEKIDTKIKNKVLKKYTLLIIIMIFSLYSFSRYSNYGNDVPASIFFFILIINLLNVKKINKFNLEEFFNISIVSIFLFTLKPSMVIVLLLPLLIFFFSVGKFKILII